ncbi:MAG: roadblock/LC7 domain-containing protein [Gemmatimonadetes bacterium]|nr:MAG: roadblock/LC7 domain-containing protein [Gemmatimonadota bacterium]
MVQGNWALFEEDFYMINQNLSKLLANSNARSVMLIDKTGQLITSAGEDPTFDTTSFASLSAADFAANSQIAALIGEKEFNTLVHQGANDSMYLNLIENRVILVVIFDKRTTLGLVRLRVKKAVEELSDIFSDVFKKLESGQQQSNPLNEAFASDAEDEIDSLFNDF